MDSGRIVKRMGGNECMVEGSKIEWEGMSGWWKDCKENEGNEWMVEGS